MDKGLTESLRHGYHVIRSRKVYVRLLSAYQRDSGLTGYEDMTLQAPCSETSAPSFPDPSPYLPQNPTLLHGGKFESCLKV